MASDGRVAEGGARDGGIGEQEKARTPSRVMALLFGLFLLGVSLWMAHGVLGRGSGRAQGVVAEPFDAVSHQETVHRAWVEFDPGDGHRVRFMAASRPAPGYRAGETVGVHFDVRDPSHASVDTAHPWAAPAVLGTLGAVLILPMGIRAFLTRRGRTRSSARS